MVGANASIDLGEMLGTRWARVGDKLHTANLAHHQTSWQLSEGNNYRSKVLWSGRFENEMKTNFSLHSYNQYRNADYLSNVYVVTFVPYPLRNIKHNPQTDREGCFHVAAPRLTFTHSKSLTQTVSNIFVLRAIGKTEVSSEKLELKMSI